MSQHKQWKEPEPGFWELLDLTVDASKHNKYHRQKKLVWLRKLPRQRTVHKERCIGNTNADVLVVRQARKIQKRRTEAQ